ncbi:MAG TPA: hypothetical protein VME47_23900 [Acetobacteraceae bacterium]|nr:hypothetical protein [Acetobacteraceae bacterium]
MSNRPSHIAYVVTDPRDKNGKAQWHPVGAIWPHNSGGGFDLVIPPGVTLSGRIVCTPRIEG